MPKSLYLDATELDALIDLLCDYRLDVARGATIPSQPAEYELAETDALLAKLKDAKSA